MNREIKFNSKLWSNGKTYEDIKDWETKHLSHSVFYLFEDIQVLNKRIAELEEGMAVPINLNRFNYAFYKTNSGSIDDFYEWLKKWKHISAGVNENES